MNGRVNAVSVNEERMKYVSNTSDLALMKQVKIIAMVMLESQKQTHYSRLKDQFLNLSSLKFGQ